MSITAAMYTGVSGLLANAEGINVIGNNIANTNTIGFKGARTLFSDMLSLNVGNNSQIGLGTQVQKIDNIFSQASFEQTTNATDLAIQGDGFFALKDAGGNDLYSRAGAFRADANGLLVNPDGLQVLDSAGVAIDFSVAGNFTAAPTGTFVKVSGVAADGTITTLMSDGTTSTYKTKIGMATVPNPGGLEKRGGTVFAATAQSGAVTIAAPTVNNKLFSNNLELSNVDMATELVNMITTQRAYSANSKTITTADEMTQEVLNLKR